MSLSKLLAELTKALPEDSPALAQAAKLGEALQPYEGLDPAQARSAIEAMKNRGEVDRQLDSIVAERDSFKTAADSYQQEALAARRELHAVRGLVAAGVRPDYEDLLLPKVSSLAQVVDGNVVIPEETWGQLKQRYPDMFHAEDGAGAGATGGGESAPASGPSYSIGSDGILTVA